MSILLLLLGFYIATSGACQADNSIWMALPKVNSAEDRQGYDWCQRIEERCQKIDASIEAISGISTGEVRGMSADDVCSAPPNKQLEDICQSRSACHSVSARCLFVESPRLKPHANVDKDKLGESGQYHDLPAFFEISEPIIQSYLRNPETKNDSVNILYFASGNHIAPLELGFQILEKTDYGRVNFTYTEIDPTYLDDIMVELIELQKNGLISDLTNPPQNGPKDTTRKEKIITFSYTTDAGEKKTVSLTFALGKVVGEEYPPYFRQTDYDNADIVMAFDAEDADVTIKSLNNAHDQSAGKDKGKILITEDRDENTAWAKGHGTFITSEYSQHYGCETNKRNGGLGLQPIVFKIK